MSIIPTHRSTAWSAGAKPVPPGRLSGRKREWRPFFIPSSTAARRRKLKRQAHRSARRAVKQALRVSERRGHRTNIP